MKNKSTKKEETMRKLSEAAQVNKLLKKKNPTLGGA